MVALETRYHGATNYRGSRISCRRMDESYKPSDSKLPCKVFISYPDELSGEAVHFATVQEFCKRYDWHGAIMPGSTDTGYVWVWVDDRRGATRFEV